MKHIVSLSGGVASAVACQRVIDRYGRENVLIWFADTSWEDEDLYRFVDDCMKRWGGELIRYCDGRNPLQVAEDEHIIPNSRVATCSRKLKTEPFTKWLKQVEKPVTVHLGLDWSEEHRFEAPKKNYESIDGVTVDFPLNWKPYEFDYFSVVRSWGITTPRLYGMGFPHNNCGGRCIRQGIGEWKRLRAHFPVRFEEVRDWEAAQREIGDARSEHAIAKTQRNGATQPLTLAEIEENETVSTGSHKQEDLFGCFCNY